jgi:hypothetical protein
MSKKQQQKQQQGAGVQLGATVSGERCDGGSAREFAADDREGIPPSLGSAAGEMETETAEAGGAVEGMGTATLTVIRVLASGEHVKCALGGRVDLVCYVRDATNFRRGMEIPGCVPRPELSERAWWYTGKLPRRPGKW